MFRASCRKPPYSFFRPAPSHGIHMSCRNISRAESDLCCSGIADFRKAAPTTLSFRKFRFAEYRSVPAEQTGFHKLRRRICACRRCVSHTLSMTRTFLQTDEAVRIQHDARTVCPQSVFKVWESWICPACGLPILRDIPDRIRDVSFFATVFGKYTRKGSREELGQ